MKLVIVGGHLSPALAVLDKLPKEVEVVWVGRKAVFEGKSALSLEYQAVTERGIRFFPIKTARLQRSFTKHTIPSLSRFPGGIYQALMLLAKERPQAVLAF